MNEGDDTERSSGDGQPVNHASPEEGTTSEPRDASTSGTPQFNDSLEEDTGEDPEVSVAKAANESLAEDWGEDPLPEDDPETNTGQERESLIPSFGQLRESFRPLPPVADGPQSSIEFLKALDRVAQEKRDVFFALYFNLPQGRRQKPPANPNDTHEVTFGELWDASGVVAYHLKNTWKIQKGQRVLHTYGYGPTGFAALLGCWRAGVAAIPVEAPTSKNTASLLRLNEAAEECHPIAIVLTDKKTFRLRNSEMGNCCGAHRKLWLSSLEWRATESLKQNPALQFLRTGESTKRPSFTYDEPSISNQDLAMIQYTAGSTEDPRPVLITFASLQASLDMTQRFFELALTNTDGTHQMARVSGMNPLPLTDGWGLVHATLLPMMNGWRVYYMSNLEFTQKPLLWLERISQHKIAWSLANDLHYLRVMEAFLQAKNASKGICPIAHLDLSCVRHWHALGQPALRVETHTLVTKELAEYGLRDSWYTASYGLTEHVAGVLFLPQEFVTCEHGTLGSSERVAVACRNTLDVNMIAKVVHPETHEELPDGKVGELWLSSAAVASGYSKMPELTNERFGATLSSSEATTERYVRTGDAAFFKKHYLYIEGSLQDAIRIDETAYYPQDLEWIAEQTSADVVAGGVAAIQLNNDIVIVYEIVSNHYHDPPFVSSQIAKAVTERLGAAPQRIVAIRQGTIPRTATGKVRRLATSERLEEESLDIMYDSVDLTQGTLLTVDSTEYLERAEDVDKVMARYFGADYDCNATWDILGLSSLTSIDLRYDIASHSDVYLLSNCFEVYRTPAELKEFVIQGHGRALPVKEPYLPLAPSKKMSWLFLGILQAVTAVIVLILFSTSAVPVWYLFEYLVLINLELALVPIFMGTFTVIVLLAKWVIIGRYVECKMTVPSFGYVRWWIMDRLMDLWEFWVGRFVVGTPVLNMFYILLGAKVSIYAQLDGFCREFDLITVGPDAHLQHRSLRARRFASWNRSEAGPKMTLRPIVIGGHSVVRGMLSPGVTIGKASVVQKLAVLKEGTQVGDRISVAGNPAVVAGHAPIMVHHSALVVGLMKLKWIFIEFWTFATLVLTSQWVAEACLSEKYFVMWPVWWMVFVAVFSTVSLLSSIIVKWLLLGKRKPGKVAVRLLSEFADWAADYHFFLSTLFFQTFSLNSRFCNIMLMMHGMDIDMASKVYFNSFPPSKMDLIRIRRSYVAGVTFDVKKYGAYYPTIVQESSIGESAHVNAGLRIQDAVIPPMCVVTAQTQQVAPNNYTPPEFSIAAEFVLSFVYTLVLVGFKASVWAAYRYWRFFDHYVAGWCVMFFLAGAIGIQSTLWMLIILVLQLLTYIGASEDHPVPWSPSLYAGYLSSSEAFQTWSAVTILWGTQLFNDVARLFGSSIEGRTLYFGNRIYDGPFLTVSNRTVSDGSQLCGHSIVYEQVKLGSTRVAGIVHEGTLVIANARTTAKESGPWRPIVKKDSQTTAHYHMSATLDLEAPETVMV